ncbi:MAG: DUF1801 domain-containing protein [Planctomycetota bacterium]|jgi:hypothetical protein
MKHKASTVKEYLDGLPNDRRKALEALRKVINKNLNKGFEEGMQYGHIAWYIPHSVYPDGYHCDPKQPLPFASVASQKNHMAVYLMCINNDPAELEWFTEAWEKTGNKLDMGKSCVRFKKIENVPLEVVGKAIKRVKSKDYIAQYEQSKPKRKKKK